jgi:hypothetical protein
MAVRIFGRARQYSPVDRSDSVRNLSPRALSDRQSFFNLDPLAVSQAIDNIFGAVPIEVILRTSNANGYFGFTTLIIDRIIDRFFEFSLNRVGAASSKKDAMNVRRSDMPAVERSAIWLPTFATPLFTWPLKVAMSKLFRRHYRPDAAAQGLFSGTCRMRLLAAFCRTVISTADRPALSR